MGQFRWSLLLAAALASSLTISHGFLLLGPKFFRSNQDYTVVMSNFDPRFGDVNVLLRMEGSADSGGESLNLTKRTVVRQNSNEMVNFKVPPSLPRGRYQFSIQGQQGSSLDRQISLVYLDTSVTGLIQLSKPVFKPGDSVSFRVIVLDTDLKPPADVKTVHVSVQDPEGNVIRRWSKGHLHVGVFEGALQVAPVPMLGTYNILVVAGGKELVAKPFEVKEYVLSTFDVDVFPTTTPLLDRQGLSLTVTARYYAGQPVNGTAKVELYLEDDKRDQSVTVALYGKAQLELTFNEPLRMSNDQQDVRAVLTFTEKHTNRTVTKKERITVYKYQHRVQLIKERPQFLPGMPFRCALRLEHQNGTAAPGVAAFVTVDELGGRKSGKLYTSDAAGAITLPLNPSQSTEAIDITVTIDGKELFAESISKQERGHTFIQVALQSAPKTNSAVRLLVTCNEGMAFFLYFVVSRGNIIDSGFVRPNRVTAYQLQLLNVSSEQTVPRSKVVVATVVDDVVVYDYVEIEYEELRNDLDLQLRESKVQPGGQLGLTLTGRPGSYVALAAYDKSLLQHSSHHDLFWEDIMRTFDGFHAVALNEFDKFHTMGLFARSFGGVTFAYATDDESGRVGASPRKVGNKLVSFRSNFVESWLWQNVTIGPQGRSVVEQTVPDTITAWHLTGFSIDPVHGLGILRRPLEFTSTQPFYVVANLPYSVKRGEAVVLQFAVFNNLPEQYRATVTLHNVDNQTEFVGRADKFASQASKSVQALPSAGVPVSFLVIARKLGEMVVRVQASIGPATDTIEQVVRVVPESLVQQARVSHFFCHDTYTNRSYPFALPVDRRADAGSNRISFSLTPNLLTSVVDNLESLLSVPTGCGEQNMVRFVPNVVVLDYLTAIGSKDKRLLTKATDLLRTGYQNQLKYRQPDGSFGVWPTSGGSIFLTAFVGKSLQAASKYLREVDAGQVAKAYDWLAAKQHRTGRFDEVGQVIHKDMQGGLRNGIALTSYVLVAFLEHREAAKKHAKVIDRALEYVSSHLGGTVDAYDLSIATYALMLQGHASSGPFLDKLIGMSKVRGNGSEVYWERSSASIETTAYALLSFVAGERYTDGTAIMRWLVGQRYATGSFPRTQDTFVGLRALAKLAEKISPARNDYTVQLRSAAGKREFRVTSKDLQRKTHAELVDNIGGMEAGVAGVGFGLLELAYEYSVDLRNFTNRFTLELEKTLSSGTARLDLRVCASFLPLLSDSRSNMALVEVNFPSGYVVQRNPISGASKANRIQNTEIRFGGTSVVVYYDNMGTERNCFTVTAYRRAKVALKRPAYVLVHDYYDPDLNAIKMYEVDSESICDVCESDDCPATC